MTKALLIVGPIYLLMLVTFTMLTKDRDKDSKTYFLAGGNLGAFLGLFTFAATLFSTFTILGMPDFFRNHGVGAWIFLAVSDLVMVFVLLWVGYHLRKRTRGIQYLGMAGFISRRFDSKAAGYIALAGAFIFLVPYVAIQIRGVAIFLEEVFAGGPSMWVYAVCMVALMLVYSEIGGLKAIIYSDTLQGIVLLVVIWIVGISCIDKLGGMETMFERVGQKDQALLSVPGPKGLFDFQFLFGSMVAICLIPFTQPQVSTRLIIMKDEKSLFKTAIGLGSFAILVILPTVFIGMYGAIHYAESSTAEFLGQTLIGDQSHLIGALVIIGLVAAAISTADSQIFALGGESRSMMSGEDRSMVKRARYAIIAFAVVALIFALLSSDQLVLLARASFAGTALLAPMIFTGIFYDHSERISLLPWATAVAIICMVLSQLHLLPAKMVGLRLDLFLLGILAVIAIIGIQMDKRR